MVFTFLTATVREKEQTALCSLRDELGKISKNCSKEDLY